MAAFLGSTVLAASLLLGQTTDGQGPAQPTVNTTKTVTTFNGISGTNTTTTTTSNGNPAAPQRGPILSWFSREDRPVLSRIQTWFGRKDPKDQEPPMTTEPGPGPRELEGGVKQPIKTSFPATQPAPQDFPRKMPNPSSQNVPTKGMSNAFAASDAQSIQQTSMQVPTSKVTTPISSKLANKIGRDEKFEWITGQLETDHGSYVLWYATPETIDKYHGHIVLQPQKADMNQFRRGDLVCVRGTVAINSTLQGATPTYRVTDVQLVERVK